MKKSKFVLLMIIMMIPMITVSISSCSKDDDSMSQFSSLFSKTDYFIDMLDEVYEHYDALGKRSSETSDYKYTVTPMGRLIIVKIKSSTSSVTYTEVKDALARHYKNNKKVKDVFINNGGTVTIDCRK